VGDPRIVADLANVKAAGVVEILWQPEEKEVPGRVAHELREDECLDIRQADDIEPSHADAGRAHIERLSRTGCAAAPIRERPPQHPAETGRAGRDEDGAPAA